MRAHGPVIPVRVAAARMALVTSACLAPCSCHSSDSLVGDTDTDHDVGHDTAVDPAHDIVTDGLSDPTPFCEPDEGAWVSWSVEDSPWPHEDMIEYECQVDSVVDEDEEWQIAMDCTSPAGLRGDVLLHVASNPMLWIPLRAGDHVLFTYIEDTGRWVNRCFLVRTVGRGGSVRGIDSSSIGPRESDPEWYCWGGNVLRTGCPSVDDECGTWARRAMDVREGRDQMTVFDGTARTMLAPLPVDVVVDTAMNYTDLECADTPEAWYSVLFVRIHD